MSLFDDSQKILDIATALAVTAFTVSIAINYFLARREEKKLDQKKVKDNKNNQSSDLPPSDFKE